jgi:adenylate cyclase
MVKMIHSLQIKLILSFIVLIIVISGLTFTYTYTEAKRALNEIIRDELTALASTTATQIDGDTLALLKPGNENTTQFLSIRDQLKNIRDSHPDIKYVYTMRKVANQIQFIVDADYGNPKDPGAAIGEIYNATPVLLQGFDHPIAETDFSTDRWGTLLSGYAPVKTSSGTVVAIVGFDISITKVIEKQNFIGNTIYGILGVAILIAASIIGLFSLTLIKDIKKLNKTTKEISIGNTNITVDVKRKDEIGELSQSFEVMRQSLNVARKKLLDAQKNLEEKIEGRTKELDKKIVELKESEIATLNIMKDLDETTNKLRRLSQIKSAFLNITSHELRTPMSAIKGHIQMILKGNLGTINDEQKHSLEVILRNTNRLNRLIQDILDISRLESGTMKFVTEKTDVTKMVKEVAETMQASADLKRIKIIAEMGIDVPELTIDKDRISQVIINLLNNAIKFSPDSSMIHIKVRKEKEDVLFEVQDYGRGIPEEHHKKIFQTFYQVDSDADTKFGGAGLGLAICYGIILAHGGRIWVESTGKPGEGSTFRFTLPVESVVNIEERFKGADVFGLEKE